MTPIKPTLDAQKTAVRKGGTETTDKWFERSVICVDLPFISRPVAPCPLQRGISKSHPERRRNPRK
jgi:hypothetical protein